MPYIKQGQRRWVDGPLSALYLAIDGNFPEEDVSGVLNYVVTRLVDKLTLPGYRRYALVIGVLETVKLEYYRRCVAGYEDKKRMEHGDVYALPT